MEANALDLFLPPVREWFRRTLGEPTPPQQQGWPVIAAGQNALILSPTGSGKTLAAFLACLDQLWRQPEIGRGVRVLYVSPLKALNNDIQRNLQEPLEGVVATARAMGFPLPVIRSHRRHDHLGETAPAPSSATRPDHDAGVAASPSDIARSGNADRCDALHRRRDSRGLRQQARRLPGSVAGASRSCGEQRIRPHRPDGNTASP